jgi:hypothetical protein
VAYPFIPMTNEMLKKLSNVTQDSNQTIKFSDFPAVFASREFKSVLELNQHRSETDHTNIRTDNRY